MAKWLLIMWMKLLGEIVYCILNQIQFHFVIILTLSLWISSTIQLIKSCSILEPQRLSLYLLCFVDCSFYWNNIFCNIFNGFSASIVCDCIWGENKFIHQNWLFSLSLDFLRAESFFSSIATNHFKPNDFIVLRRLVCQKKSIPRYLTVCWHSIH